MKTQAPEARRAERRVLLVLPVLAALVLLVPVVAPHVRPILVRLGAHETGLQFFYASEYPRPIPHGLHRWPSMYPQTIWSVRIADGVYLYHWQSRKTAEQLRQLAARQGVRRPRRRGNTRPGRARSRVIIRQPSPKSGGQGSGTPSRDASRSSSRR